MNRWTYSSPFGQIVISASSKQVHSLCFAEGRFDEGVCTDPIVAEVNGWLDRYFAGDNPDMNFSLQLAGTLFQHQVWEEILNVPYATTMTYGQMAGLLRERGINASAQAVGQAAARNPIGLLIPCHRLVATSAPGGYAWGTARKVRLIAFEKGE